METTKLLTEPTWKFQVWADTGKFELPQAANENLSGAVKTSLEAFKEKLLETTALTPVQSQVSNFKNKLLETTALTPVESQLQVFWNRALSILTISELWKLTPPEETTAKLALFFWKSPVEVISRDRADAQAPQEIRYVEPEAANDNYTPLALAA